MKLQDLNGSVLVLVLVAILLGVGLTVLGSVSLNSRTQTGYVNDRINATNSSCVQLTNNYIISSTAVFTNGTPGSNGNSISASCFTWDNTDRYKGDCVTLNPGSCSTDLYHRYINVSYNYGASSTAQSTVDTTITGIGGFGGWFSIIVVVLVAAVIIGLVIRSFNGRE